MNTKNAPVYHTLYDIPAINGIPRSYKLRPDSCDTRDYLYTPKPGTVAALPASVDLRPGMTVIRDQSNEGSCTSFALAGAVNFERNKLKLTPIIDAAPAFIYYAERTIEGTTKSDAGAMLRDGVAALAKQGVCDEKLCPYVVGKFATKPSAAAYQAALSSIITSYARVGQDLASMQGCLAEGFPFVVGIQVYGSFESDVVAKTGTVPMPNTRKEQLLGGHAILIVGYDSAKKVFICRNSWGTGWGMAGYFTLPFDYLTSATLASDLWTLRAGK